MFLWYFILFIFVFDSVLGNSTESHNKTKHVVPDRAKKSNDQKVNSAELKRPLQEGDTFVPMELLPITRKLFAKIKPGEGGRGIVSGSKTPEEMAEKIYRAYFLTPRRIAILTAKDLRGLDLLTALAMDGEVVKTKASGDSVTEKPKQILNLNGQFIGVNPGPPRCQYKLLYKTVTPPDSESLLRKKHGESSTPFTRILKMEKKMRPNRSLIVNHKGRRSNKYKRRVNIDSKLAKKQKKRNKSTRQEKSKEGKEKVLLTTYPRQNCRRPFFCADPHDVNTCQQITSCFDRVSDETLLDMKKSKSKQNRRKNHKKTNRQNKRRRHLTRNKKSKNRRRSQNKISKSNSTENPKYLRNESHEVLLTTTQRPSCRWRFFCQDPRDVDTCKLHTSCFDGANNKPMLHKGVVDTIENDQKEKEKTELVMHFRKMLKITSLDEDVEKIIEQHVALVKPENLAPNAKVESLDQYFNNIIMAEFARYTTPSPIEDTDKSQSLLLDADSNEKKSQEQNAALMGLKTKEKTVKKPRASTDINENQAEPSASTDINENQANTSPGLIDTFGALEVTTTSMQASTSE